MWSIGNKVRHRDASRKLILQAGERTLGVFYIHLGRLYRERNDVAIPILNLLDDGVPHDPEDPYDMNRYAEIFFAAASCRDPAM